MIRLKKVEKSQRAIGSSKKLWYGSFIFNLLATYLKDLKSISIKRVKLKKLKSLVRKKYSSQQEILILRSIENTLIYKSLKVDKRIKNY